MRTLLILPIVGLLALGAQHGVALMEGDGASPSWAHSPASGPIAPPDIEVVDGDTVRVRGRPVRLLGFDTPETHEPRCAREARLGREATAELRRLVRSGARLDLRPRPGRDRYGWGLGRLAVGGRDMGEALIAAGLARPYGGGRRGGWC